MAISLPSTVIFHVSPNIVDLYNQRGSNRYNKPLASGDKPNELDLEEIEFSVYFYLFRRKGREV